MDTWASRLYWGALIYQEQDWCVPFPLILRGGILPLYAGFI
jgi:hypothetical protein